MAQERNSRDEITKKRWSEDEYMVFVECLKLTGRYTFTEEDFAKASGYMYARFGIERTAKQLELKYKELRRCHLNPQMCEFFNRIRECEMETKLNASNFGACENGASSYLLDMVKTEMPERDGSSQNNRSSDPGPSLHSFFSSSSSCSDNSGDTILFPSIPTEREEEGRNERVEESKKEEVEERKQEKEEERKQNEEEEAGKKSEVEERGGGREKAEKRKIEDDDDDIQVIDETPPRSLQKRRDSQVKREAADTSGVGCCPKCKASVNGSNRFCNACGHPLPIRCYDCDKEVQPTAKFCGNCGARQNK